ncbi:MAG: hypothetical protein ABSG08_22715 [Terriglobales bacterium]|jgi:hypothetical protein
MIIDQVIPPSYASPMPIVIFDRGESSARQQTKAENRIKAASFKLIEPLEDISQNEFDLVLWNLVCPHIVLRMLDKVLSGLDTQHIASPGLMGREAPTAIVGRNV